MIGNIHYHIRKYVHMQPKFQPLNIFLIVLKGGLTFSDNLDSHHILSKFQPLNIFSKVRLQSQTTLTEVSCVDNVYV